MQIEQLWDNVSKLSIQSYNKRNIMELFEGVD